MENNRKFLDEMEEAIMNADIPESEKSKLIKNVLHLKEQKVNLMITGATGSGNSSTINALFDMEVAKVGVGVTPETMEIEKHELGNLILWDSPGLGDGIEADKRHTKNIIQKLNERDANGNLLIDLVLVILDGGTRNMGTDLKLITQVILPNLGEDKKGRILVAINQADMALKGRYWDYEKNEPEPKLLEALNDKVNYIHDRIKSDTGVDTTPIYYCAGFKEEGMPQGRPYNLSKLLYYIVKSTPKEKRLSYVDHINQDADMWKDDDGKQDYSGGILKELATSVREYAAAGADLGGEIGSVFGRTGETLGRAVGSVAGGVVGFFKGIFG